jgi:hypothetical protein
MVHTYMVMNISLEVFGEAAISRELLRFGTRAADASPAFEIIATMFYDSEKKQFDTQGEWASGGWAPLAPSTIAAKLANPSLSNMILQSTGAMMESLTTSTGDFSSKHVSPDKMELLSTVPYGVFHQQPEGPGKGILPMRKPVELPEHVKVDIVKVLQAWIVGDTGVSI